MTTAAPAAIHHSSLTTPPLDPTLLSETEKKELITADAISLVSDTSTTVVDPAESLFYATKTLNIAAKGIPVLRLPAPSSELEISIYNSDGSLAYQSTRAQPSSGSCVLTDSEGRNLVATEYFFGPGRDPVLHVLALDKEDASSEGKTQDIQTVSKWTSRAQSFLLPGGRAFTWEYKKEKGFGKEGKKGTALVMTFEGQRVAVLVRNRDTRTLGSKSYSAGNGGKLMLGRLSGACGEKGGIAEEIVVASCLLMLKKEIDRRRMVQAIMISAAVT